MISVSWICCLILAHGGSHAYGDEPAVGPSVSQEAFHQARADAQREHRRIHPVAAAEDQGHKGSNSTHSGPEEVHPRRDLPPSRGKASLQCRQELRDGLPPVSG